MYTLKFKNFYFCSAIRLGVIYVRLNVANNNVFVLLLYLLRPDTQRHNIMTLNATAMSLQRDIIRDAKSRQTAGEKNIYLAFQLNRHSDVAPNTVYELETRTRQELLMAITPYFTQIIQYLTTPAELQLLNRKFPRWIENIFTRNTRASNRIYMESMMGVGGWAKKGWNSECFNVFCSTFSSEINALLRAGGITVKPFNDFKYVVRVVTQIGGWWLPAYQGLSAKESKIYQMGCLFKACQDDSEDDATCSDYFEISFDQVV